MEGRKAFGLLCAMRTGKSKATLDDFGRLWAAGHVDDLLVIAPAGVYRTWVRAIEDHVGEPLASELWTKVWSAQDGQGIAAQRVWAAFMTHPGERTPRCLLVNVEALSTVKRARELVLNFCRQRRVYAVVDESTAIKSPRSRRARFVVEKVGPLCAYRRILTGLIAPKSPDDVFQQFEFLRPGILGFNNVWQFRGRYAVQKTGYAKGAAYGQPRTFTQIVGWRDQDDLRSRMEPHSFRVRLSDCYDLPPKLYETREVELTDEQERVYRELQKYATVELSEAVHVTATQACTQVLRLHQVLCGHVGDEDGVRRMIESNRIGELLALLQEWDDGTGKAIVWAAYDADIQGIGHALKEAYGPRSLARFWGGNRPEREDEERRFLTDPGCRFMVATPAAGGRGRTWTVADLVTYYSSTMDLEHREQSEERAQGVDKNRSTLYVDLLAKRQNGKDTVDQTVLYCLKNKIKMSSLLMGDGWKRWVV